MKYQDTEKTNLTCIRKSPPKLLRDEGRPVLLSPLQVKLDCGPDPTGPESALGLLLLVGPTAADLQPRCLLSAWYREHLQEIYSD